MAVSKLSFKNDFTIEKTNIDTVLAYLQSDFSTASDSDKLTWKLNSFYGTAESDGRFMYYDYWMREFYALNTETQLIQSVELLSGIVSGFGVATYGIETFGTARTGYIVSKSYQDRMNRYFIITWIPVP